jgi:ligand-binding sensor domain-containing protein
MQKVLILTVILLYYTIMPFCYGQLSWTTYDVSNTGGGLPSDIVYSIAIDNNGDKWIGTREVAGQQPPAVIKFDGTTWTNQNLSLSSGSSNPNLHNRIWIIFVDSQDNIWAGTHGDGLYKFDGTTWSVFTMTDGLGGNYVRDIVEDAQGNLWFGCGPEPDTYPAAVGGLTKYDGNTFSTFLSNYCGTNNVGGGNSDLVNNYVYALTIDLQGHIWAGAKYRGVSRFNPTTLQWTNYNMSNGLPENEISAGAANTDLNGNIRVGFSSQSNFGAAIFNGSSWAQLWDLYGTRMRDIVHDHFGNVWFGDKDANEALSEGLWKFDGTNYNSWDTGNSNIAGNRINMITIDHPTGDIWIATDVGGISVLSGAIPPSSIEKKKTNLIRRFDLAQNYPNPFNPETFIEYSVDVLQHIKLCVYDINGKLIRTLENGNKQAGFYKVQWDGKDDQGQKVSSGFYLYQVVTDRGHRIVKKALLLK